MHNPYEPPSNGDNDEREEYVEPLVYWDGFFMVVLVISSFFVGEVVLCIIRDVIESVGG